MIAIFFFNILLNFRLSSTLIGRGYLRTYFHFFSIQIILENNLVQHMTMMNHVITELIVDDDIEGTYSLLTKRQLEALFMETVLTSASSDTSHVWFQSF